ncbi:MAG TPA: hypothetical protein H9913_12760 [Candidatus Blautia stercoripullorum]|mgnify:CR=1 FL=1|uniref:Peptidoglycan hydrolase PcsB coiled-coil domain-containing protein n=1 Tax=Candidatus Blautia stercoripullorum TaxID=2838502 RepID=A0A9D2REG6_9FIRM|nr:hypothetical protein [Candidatus Blautia stercoripullorum]
MKKKTSTSLLMGLLAASLAAVPCYASSTQQKITDTKNARQESQQKLNDTQSKIDSLESKKNDLEGYLQKLNGQLGDLEENLQEIQTKSEETQKNLQKLKTELEAAKEKEAQQYEDMKLRIQYMYENSESSYMIMLLESNSISDFLSQAENMSQITSYDRNMLDEYKATTKEIEKKEADIEEEQQELEELEQESLEKQDEIYEAVKSTNVQIREYSDQISKEKGTAKNLVNQIESQEDAINTLLKQQKDEEAAQILAQRQQAEKEAESSSQQSGTAPSQGNAASSSQSSSQTSTSQTQQPEQNSGNTYLGRFRLTGYCPCAQCCGKSDGITASGTKATAGRTVAMGGVPLGTKLLINGVVYTVEDRGTSYSHVDIFFNTHGEALQFGSTYADVYLVN